MFNFFGPSTPYIEGPWTWDRRGYDQAKANFIAIHGFAPHPLFNAYTLYDEYREPKGELAIMLMNADQLAQKVTSLGLQIDAAKQKQGMA